LNREKMPPLGKITKCCILGAFGLLISPLALTASCYGSELVFIRSNRSAAAVQDQAQIAASFYGLQLRIITAGPGGANLSTQTLVDQKQTVGVVIDADALSTVNENALLPVLKRKMGGDIPLLILGVGPDLSPALLKTWSGGEVTGSARIKSQSVLHYEFGSIEDLTRQLAKLEVSFSATETSYFTLGDRGAARWIESAKSKNDTFPVFIETEIGGQRVFLACSTPERREPPGGEDVVSAFMRTAPAMIFVRYCAGERGWHSLHYYANFTIDDPWLREPYGWVDYDGLLGEMEKHHFHTTIAFIPWNYDRSQSEVVSVIRDHPDKFSIAVHGNNHDHKEFTDYRSNPMTDQVADLKQGLARMERFRVLTGIPYDKVMIFPHSIAPEQTLEALKTYNFLATVNSSNVPQGAARPASLSDALRPVTLSFAGFPSISRNSAEVQSPDAYLAINQFLGNPLFFYDHSDLFSKGIGAFDHVADEVNRLEPATEWRSLGEIVRHFYVVRLREDSNYDVLAFSNNICLENRAGRSTTFYVQKQETDGQRIGSVTVDGASYPYSLQDGKIRLGVLIPPGGVRNVSIQYANNLQLESTDPKHDSFVVYSLRIGSDFRDIYLAKSSIGLAAIRFYNEHELTPTEVIGCLLLLLVAMIYLGYRLWITVRMRMPSTPDRASGLLR
jgi:hypothetical protein